MRTGLRKVMMASLLACFVGQTAMVYADDTADRTPPLSEQALAGRRIFHDHNCQACHQIYGFGGFLGPDLTNAGGRLTRERLDDVLTNGNAQMPAFHLDASQIDALEAFLRELDATGVGVPRAFVRPEPQQVWAAIDAHAGTAPALARDGLGLFRGVCGACHTPLCSTPLGPHTAPDLSTVCDRLSDEDIVATISNGRIERGMPAQPHMAAFGPQLLALLHWLHDARAAIAGELGGSGNPEAATALPWWEFK
ncbi:MAG: cytochrome c [Planctomycetes bacterium]|nr:cytochrome c [Planctomycetota bacterium]